MPYCISYYPCIKTRYTLSYLRAHRIGPDRLYDPGRFFSRSGRFTPIAPLKFFIQNRRCTSGFFSWGFLSDGTLYFRVPAGDPGSPSCPAPSVRMGAARRPGTSGPQPPRRPLPPAPTQNKVLYTLLRKLRRGYALQNLLFCASAGPALGWAGRSLPLPVDSRGASPPRHPPIGAGARKPRPCRSARGFAPPQAPPRPPRSAGFAAPRPGRLRPSLAPPQRRPHLARRLRP